MQTTPELEALLEELTERSAVVDELDGPQIEAWVSSLFPLFDDGLTPARFLEHCVEQGTSAAALLCEALGALTTGDVRQAAVDAATALASVRPPSADQIGNSTASVAWMVTAPFGSSIVIGFENPVELDEEADTRHSMLVELNKEGAVEDIQLAGPPSDLVEEAVEVGDRVRAESVSVDVAADAIVAAWPHAARNPEDIGPGLLANETFVRSRLRTLTGLELPPVEIATKAVDIRRGLTDDEYVQANTAARSTLRAALGTVDLPGELNAHHQAWIGVIHGDGGELSQRERDALLWLEWADWLGAGIGMIRSGPGTVVDGSALVDLVNRCPEVSSSIEKGDRDYAEWAFDVALDLLKDAEVVSDGVLTKSGFDTLHTALVSAFS